MRTLFKRLDLKPNGVNEGNAFGFDRNGEFAQALEDGNQRYLLEALIDQIPDFLFIKDDQCRFIAANASIARAYGLSTSELIGKTDYDLHPAARADIFFRYEQEIIQSGCPLFNMEETFPNELGIDRWYSTTKIPLRNAEGVTIGLIGIGRDITEHKIRQSFDLKQSIILEMIAKNDPLKTIMNDLVHLIEAQIRDIIGSILLFDAEKGVLCHGAAPNLSDAYCRAIDGLAVGPKAGSCGTAVFRREPVVVSDITTDPLWDAYRMLPDHHRLRSCWSTPIKAHDGGVTGTFALYSRSVRTPTADETSLMNAAARLAGIAIDRHRSEERLLHMAHHDGLTGLPNRLLCLSRLSVALSERLSKGHRVALHYIDLDGFKPVNDTLGHFVGDVLLKKVGARLREIVPEAHMVARLGGDEFAVIQLLEGQEHREQSAALAAHIADALKLPFGVRDNNIAVGASIGVAIAPEDDDDPETLLRDADMALYQAKAEERGGFRFFEPEMSVHAYQRRMLEADLRRALENRELELYYQPQIDIASNQICGFEALLRWRHQEHGLIQPMDFIGVAEEIGLIVPMGDWVLRQACAQAATWPTEIRIAVNLSPVQFKHPGLYASVVSALDASGLAPKRLELEITESVLLLDSEANLALLHRFRTLGVQISLDDFGTGYSSLSYLRSFPFTKIKIDRSFVRDIETNPGCLAIVRAVSRLAIDLGMRTTAEGVETLRQLDQLRNEGCNEAQGYLFSPPVPVSAASLLLEPTTLLYDAA